MKNICLCFMVSLFPVINAYAQDAGKPTENVANALTIIDSDGTRVVLTEENLREMPQITAEQCIWVGKSSGYIGIFDYSGASLKEVLKRAEKTANAKEYRQENSYVVFRGTDGYQVLASWTELMESPDGRSALIALNKDGAPLSSTEGRFRLVLPGDKYVGRSVKWLSTIEIHCAVGFTDFVDKEKGQTTPSEGGNAPSSSK